MKRQNKITLVNGLTVLAAFFTFMCLFAIDGISVQTVVALAAAYGCAYITVCLFKVENILRRQQAIAKRKAMQKAKRSSLSVVRGNCVEAA